MATKDMIISLPNGSLRTKSKRVSFVDEKIKQVINDMKSATLDWEASREHEVGVALAAVQIDELYKIIVIRNNFDDKEDHSFSVFINPEIIKTEGEVEDDFEGCLSVRDIYGRVPRYSRVKVKAINEQGQEVRVKAEGFLARVFQHEIDHINGKVFVDHIIGNRDAFFKLTNEGKLDKLDYDDVEATDIFRK